MSGDQQQHLSCRDLTGSPVEVQMLIAFVGKQRLLKDMIAMPPGFSTCG